MRCIKTYEHRSTRSNYGRELERSDIAQSGENQAGFVPENLYSIAEAQFYPEARSLAIYNEAAKMVGYALYGREHQSGKWKIFRLMIDASHQQKGYGRAAMVQLIAEIRHQQPDCSEILIAYQTKNQTAHKLYASLGFVGETQSGDVTTAKWMHHDKLEST